MGVFSAAGQTAGLRRGFQRRRKEPPNAASRVDTGAGPRFAFAGPMHDRKAMSRILRLVPPLAALALGGCITHSVRPTPSRAILEARAHHATTHEAKACPDLASPAEVEFGFNEGALSDLDTPALAKIAAALACHPGAGAVVVGQADGHGTAADRRKLAGDRAQAVVAELQRRGVAAGRVTTQVEGKEPAGDAQRLVILAEGRRW